MRLIAGLGNPGERYRRTRHNVGFMVVDVLAERAHVVHSRVESDAWVAEGRLGDEDVILVKPLTFMNRSGASLLPLMQARQLGPAELTVIVDDVALDLGTLRVRERGSHGGHNGLRSIIDVLGSEDFSRVRVGIRRGDPPADLAGWVLSDFAADEVLVVQEVVGWAADAIESLVRDGAAAAMNRYNAPKT